MALGGLQNEADLDRHLDAYLAQFGKVNGSSIAGPAFSLISQTTEPPDAALKPGQLAIWLDPTVGTTVAKFKAKNAAGTVVTANVALT